MRNTWERSGKIAVSTSLLLFSLLLLHGRLIVSYEGVFKIYGWSGVGALALAILGTLMLIKGNSKYTPVGVTAVVLLMFLPQFLAKLPIFTFVYRIYGHVLYVMQTGHINPDLPSLRYQTWPGIMLMGALINYESNVGVFLLLTLPLLFYVSVVPLVYYFLLSIVRLSKEHSWLGMLFFIFSFYGFMWFVPGSLATLIKAVGMYILLKLLLRNIPPTVEIKTTLGIMTIAIIISHFLTSMFWFVFLIDVLVLSYLWRKKELSSTLVSLTVLFIVFQFYWLFSYTYPIYLLKQKMSEFIAISKATSATERWTRYATVGRTPYAQVLRIKAYFVYLIIILGFLGTMLSITVREHRKTVIVLLVIIASYIIGIPAIAGGYGGEVASRLLTQLRYLLAILVAISFLARSRLGEIYRKTLIALLLVLLMLQVYCTYGNLVMDYVAPNEIEGVFYASSHLPGTMYVISDPIWDISPRFLTGSWRIIIPIRFAKHVRKGYFILSERIIKGYEFMHGAPPPNFNETAIVLKGNIVYCSSNGYPHAHSTFRVVKIG